MNDRFISDFEKKVEKKNKQSFIKDLTLNIPSFFVGEFFIVALTLLCWYLGISTFGLIGIFILGNALFLFGYHT